MYSVYDSKINNLYGTLLVNSLQAQVASLTAQVIRLGAMLSRAEKNLLDTFSFFGFCLTGNPGQNSLIGNANDGVFISPNAGLAWVQSNYTAYGGGPPYRWPAKLTNNDSLYTTVDVYTFQPSGTPSINNLGYINIVINPNGVGDLWYMVVLQYGTSAFQDAVPTFFGTSTNVTTINWGLPAGSNCTHHCVPYNEYSGDTGTAWLANATYSTQEPNYPSSSQYSTMILYVRCPDNGSPCTLTIANSLIPNPGAFPNQYWFNMTVTKCAKDCFSVI
nr:MAG: hypothetical protein [Cressdnaviricota sp.]